jgi:hypothetical protein
MLREHVPSTISADYQEIYIPEDAPNWNHLKSVSRHSYQRGDQYNGSIPIKFQYDVVSVMTRVHICLPVVYLHSVLRLIESNKSITRLFIFLYYVYISLPPGGYNVISLFRPSFTLLFLRAQKSGARVPARQPSSCI